jgi:hypothetical protein
MMTEKLIVEEPVEGFTERDGESKAILNTDRNKLLQYKIQRQRFININNQKEEIDDLKKDVKSMKDDLLLIKDSLRELLQRQ